MELLKQRLREDATLLPGNVLRADSFLSHRIDVALIDRIGEEFYRLFKESRPNKIVTVESSGIPVALSVARCFGLSCLVAKKGFDRSAENSYQTRLLSYIDKQDYMLRISRLFLERGDRVLLIDDFLATGSTLHAMMEILSMAGATLAGIGIVVEKGFQHGGDELRAKGVNLKSLCIVDSVDNGIRFRDH
ncbi:MAG: xanthine phosphoribosyltransferase [Clostridia bacterium]|nr:xanthine phosphoribosyltransferase [Clostridia bacterium]